MNLSEDYPDAFERAAKAVHEAYFGRDTWKASPSTARSQARLATRLMVEALKKNGVILQGEGAPAQPGQSQQPEAERAVASSPDEPSPKATAAQSPPISRFNRGVPPPPRRLR